ncbi:hypothetical protein DL768_010256 [Monosporascus sp. mg162]|nr:hypothetical protein DL768_010256 [Monosporascus sp. mg162]
MSESPEPPSFAADASQWVVWEKDSQGRIVAQEPDDFYDFESEFHEQWIQEQRRRMTNMSPIEPMHDDSGVEVWPYRLLHVDSMTSHIRTAGAYNGYRNPPYNILSYTWGFYQDDTGLEAPLQVYGVDWPIPRIKSSHFTADGFHQIIKRVAQGHMKRCEWVWVDIACIPQKHGDETPGSEALRNQEIGRQANIFRRAQESFAWLSSLENTHLVPNAKQPPTLSVLGELKMAVKQLARNRGSPCRDGQTALELGRDLEEYADLFVPWTATLLAHPWFMSLWTLQEMVMCKDMYILTDSGFIPDIWGYNSEARPYLTVESLTCFFSALEAGLSLDKSNLPGDFDKTEIGIGQDYVPKAIDHDQEEMARLANDTLLRAQARVQHVCRLSTLYGFHALGRHGRTVFPHSAYSISHLRRSLLPEDRIYGIQQVYGISCSPVSPDGNDPDAKLRTLEDEFGLKLIAKAPLLSQLFIHGSFRSHSGGTSSSQTVPIVPRRSWLITQNCIVDTFWHAFHPTETTDERNFICMDEFSYFGLANETSQARKRQGPGINDETLLVRFTGRAWYLDELVKASSTDLKDSARKLLFNGNQTRPWAT